MGTPRDVAGVSWEFDCIGSFMGVFDGGIAGRPMLFGGCLPVIRCRGAHGEAAVPQFDYPLCVS